MLNKNMEKRININKVLEHKFFKLAKEEKKVRIKMAENYLIRASHSLDDKRKTKYYKKATDIFNELKVINERVAIIYNNIGTSLKNKELQIYCLKRALEVYEELKIENGAQALTYNNLGVISTNPEEQKDNFLKL